MLIIYNSIDWLERLISEVTYCVSNGTLNSTNSTQLAAKLVIISMQCIDSLICETIRLQTNVCAGFSDNIWHVLMKTDACNVLCVCCVKFKSDLEHTLSQLVVDDDDDDEAGDDTESHAHSVPIVCFVFASFYCTLCIFYFLLTLHCFAS